MMGVMMTKREYRSVPEQFNKMAVCSSCKRKATQTSISWLCVDLVERRPTICDECRNPLQSANARDTLVQGRDRRNVASRVFSPSPDLQAQERTRK